jgi:DNA-binding NarL/FixJ family response regulator
VKTTRILIADDHELMRQGLLFLLEKDEALEVCGLAESGREAVDQAINLHPDIVVLDMSMPELTGLEAARKIKRALPQTEILIFTANENEDVIRQVFDAGAKSYIQKSEASSYLLDAIRALREHKPFFTNSVAEVLFAKFVNSSGDSRSAHNGSALSEREREVVRLLGEGKSNKEVAVALGISTRTVEVHRANAMKKVAAKSFSELIRWAIRNCVINS